MRRAAFHKGQLGEYVKRQAALGGASDPEALAQQLTFLHNGAADYALLYGRYPEFTQRAVATLLTAHGIT